MKLGMLDTVLTSHGTCSDNCCQPAHISCCFLSLASKGEDQDWQWMYSLTQLWTTSGVWCFHHSKCFGTFQKRKAGLQAQKCAHLGVYLTWKIMLRSTILPYVSTIPPGRFSTSVLQKLHLTKFYLKSTNGETPTLKKSVIKNYINKVVF